MRKTALITGASKGIGFAIAKVLDSQFENLILVARNKENLQKAASKLRHAKITIISADLEDEKQIGEVAKTVKDQFDSLDVLVNNAGVYIGKRFEKTPLEEINKMINLNFRAYTLLTHQLLKLIEKGENPQIINTSSCAGSAQIFGESLYSATKAAVTAFSNVIRKELNEKGIRVTAIQPWGVDTYEEAQPDYLLDPEEIGKLVNFIVNTSPLTQIDTVELSHIKQWRGTKPPWIE